MIKLVMIALGFLWPYLVKLFWFLLAAVGVGAVSYLGTLSGIEYFLERLVAAQANVPVAVAQFATAFGVHLIIAGIVAGVLTRVSISGIGTLKRLVFKGAT